MGQRLQQFELDRAEGKSARGSRSFANKGAAKKDAPTAAADKRLDSCDGQLAFSSVARWTARRKAVLMAAVRGGKITMEDATRHYQLSEEEFLGWVRAFEKSGTSGLRARPKPEDPV